MGYETVYCASCQIRLGGLDFENKKAFRVGLTVCCAKCLNSVLASADPADVAAFRAKTEPATRPAPPTARVRTVQEEPKRRLWPVGAAAAALVVLGLCVAVLRPAPPAPPKAPEPAARAEAPAPPPPEPVRPAREEWADLEKRAAPLEAAERFRDAAAIFEAARGPAADRRVADLHRKAEALLPAAQERERVARWGYPDLLAVFDRRTAAATPAPPPPPPVENRAAEPWKAAMRSASARRFGEAIAALEAAGPEAAADAALLKDVQALHDEGLRAFAARPAGAAVSLRVYDGEVSGVVRRAGPRRLELESGDYVEADALTLRSLVSLAATSRPLATAVAAALDGEAAEGQPEKYAAYAREAAAHRPKADPAELDARKRFYEAERAWADEERRAEAVVLYRDLLRSEAAVAREELDRIRARTELPKERFFPALELRAAGDFRFAAVEKAETAWIRGAAAGEASVEIAFPALPDSAYRLWAYVGGCCAENFAFSCQVDDLVQPVKHSLLFLKKTHAQHGGPREPKRWEWIALPLPKFAAPGLKRVRLISDREGFAVAAAQLSASRSAPPGDVETREQLRKTALPSKPVDEALVVWWKLDAGRGAVAVDASGRGGHGTIQGAQWRTSEGRAGLWFDGVDDGLSMPEAALANVESFTIAFWARPEAERAVTPEETSGATGTKDQRYAVYPGHGGDDGRAGLGVSVGRNGVSVFEHATAHMPSLLVHDAAIGGWVHVAVVFTNKKPVLHLDGVRAREGLASGKRVFPSAQVSLSDYGRYAGMLADLRVYKRPLSDQEVKQVCGRPAPEPRR